MGEREVKHMSKWAVLVGDGKAMLCMKHGKASFTFYEIADAA
jgi:hypothetical protein